MPKPIALARVDLPLHRQLRAVLLDQLANGELRAGDRLPTEHQLCSAYKVSRKTVRQALDDLEREGLIERTPGRGTFVSSALPRRVGRADHTRMEIRSTVTHGADREGRVISVGSSVPSVEIAKELGLRPGEDAMYFTKVLTEGAPRAALTRFFAPSMGARLTDQHRAARNFRALLATMLKCPIYLSHGWFDAILAQPRFAMMLKVPIGTALSMLTWVEMAADAPVMCSQMVFARSSISIDFFPE